MRVAILILLAMLATGQMPVFAEEVEKRFRLSVSFGGLNNLGEVRSDATNILSINNEDGETIDRFFDPRNDDAAVGTLELQGGGIAGGALQYAINRFFLVELAASYQKTDLGDVEVQGQTFPVWTVMRVPVGEVERVPLQLSGIARLRPQSSFNPYVGAGVGYTIVGFESDEAFDALSVNLDRAKGRLGQVTSENFGLTVLAGAGEFVEMTGAHVDARDTFSWHVVGGAELTFANHWAALIDLRYVRASREVLVGFNGGVDLGVAVPQATVDEGSAAQFAIYGPMQLLDGGLMDFNRDGEVDPGFYYINGGKIDLDALSFQVGIRYTF